MRTHGNVNAFRPDAGARPVDSPCGRLTERTGTVAPEGDTEPLTYVALSTSPARIVGVRKILRPPFHPGGGKRARTRDSHFAGQETSLQTRRQKSPSV